MNAVAGAVVPTPCSWRSMTVSLGAAGGARTFIVGGLYPGKAHGTPPRGYARLAPFGAAWGCGPLSLPLWGPETRAFRISCVGVLPTSRFRDSRRCRRDSAGLSEVA